MRLSDFLRDKGVPVAPAGHHHVTSERWVGVDCPFCPGPPGKFRMGIRQDGRVARCWGCGRHRPVEVLAQLTGMGLSDLRRALPLLDPEERTVRKGGGLLRVPKGVGPMMPVHRAYLKLRGFDPDEISRVWDVQGIGMAPRLGWRLYIPVYQDDEVVTWTTRSIADDPGITLRYWGADDERESKVPVKHTLYGADYCRHTVIVVEGPSDVWRVGPGAAATYGVSYTKAQAAKLSSYPLRVVCYDNDPEGQRAAARLCDELACFPGDTINVALDAADPGSASPREILLLRTHFLGE